MQTLKSLERQTSPDPGRSNVERSEAALALAFSCLESISGRKPEDAYQWLLLAASLGDIQAKSSIYRVSKALHIYDSEAQRILPYVIESAREGIPIAVEDLMEACPEKFHEVLGALKSARRRQCQYISPE